MRREIEVQQFNKHFSCAVIMKRYGRIADIRTVGRELGGGERDGAVAEGLGVEAALRVRLQIQQRRHLRRRHLLRGHLLLANACEFSFSDDGHTP